MGAKLISPDGVVQELTLEEYVQIKTQFISKLPTRTERLNALMELIKEVKEEGDDEMWDELEKMLYESQHTM